MRRRHFLTLGAAATVAATLPFSFAKLSRVNMPEYFMDILRG